MVAVHFLPESQYPGVATGNFIYKPTVLDEKQHHLKEDQSRSHKSIAYLKTIYKKTPTRDIADQNKRKLYTRAPNDSMALR